MYYEGTPYPAKAGVGKDSLLICADNFKRTYTKKIRGHTLLIYTRDWVYLEQAFYFLKDIKNKEKNH